MRCSEFNVPDTEYSYVQTIRPCDCLEVLPFFRRRKHGLCIDQSTDRLRWLVVEMEIQKKPKHTITSDEEISRSTKNGRKKTDNYILTRCCSVVVRPRTSFCNTVFSLSINSEIRVKMLVVFSVFLKHRAIIWCFLDSLTGVR